MTANKTRNHTVDLERGVALLTMFWANLAGNVLVQPHPLWFRLIGTFAASLFVMISGHLAGWLQAEKNRPGSYYWKRGFVILGVACFMDAETGLVPLFSVDVLYIIALATLLVPFFFRMQFAAKVVVTALILGLTPAMQDLLGYKETPDYLEFSTVSKLFDSAVLIRLAKQWIVDGYFPIFPWVGLFFLGALLDPLRRRYESLAEGWRLPVLIGLLVGLLASAVIWKAFPGELFVRENYSEMFYPPSVGYVLTASFVTGFLYVLLSMAGEAAVLRPLAVLGSASMPLYVLHYIFIERFFNPRFTNSDHEPLAHLSEFLVLYAILTAAMWCVSYLLRVLRRQDFWSRAPFVLRVILGS